MAGGLAGGSAATVWKRVWAGETEPDRFVSPALSFGGRTPCMRSACRAHQNAALRWDGADGRFRCPKYHSKYRSDGTFIEGRATRNMDRFTVQRDGDMIVVDVDAMHKSDDDRAAWASAVVHL